MRAASLKPRKAPRQRRSTAMVALILQAAARVLERESLSGFNTNRVAEVAGISVGSLYQYFPNKDALVAALIARDQEVRAEALEAVFAELANRPFGEALRLLAQYAVRQQYARPLLAAALDHEERRLPVGPVLRAAEARILHSVATWLETHRNCFMVPLPAEAAQDCMTITRAMVEADIDRAPVPAANLEQRLVRALAGYLSIRPGALDP